MPADSRMDPTLAKAKPVRNDSNASVITYLRRQRKSYTFTLANQSVTYWKREKFVTTVILTLHVNMKEDNGRGKKKP
ncbi:hypothetical protein WISP_149205 [Willisornis vidua]|uniref:Uncharacterized protein n=1 Tax=Willisornis vidua TaxID=1566151 RepID=A0ABQ9CPL2_9PASS|nr:hypothetical protein WISP_149205 [Willisornis vidua]